MAPYRSSAILVRLGAALLLLALWAQAAAPLASPRRDAGAPASLRAIDPSLQPVICGRPADRSTVAGEPGQGPAGPDCEACALGCCGAAAPVPPRIDPVARRHRWIPVAWPIPPPARARVAPRRSARARAPPASS